MWSVGLWAGGLFSAGFFISREHAQAQRKYAFGYIAAFDVRCWSWDARLDALCPVLACLVLVVSQT
jgi:hypothetical protein